MGKDVAGLITRVNYRRRDTFTCTVGSHLPHYHHRFGIITPTIAGTNLPTPKGWIALLVRTHLYVHNLLRVITQSDSKVRAGI